LLREDEIGVRARAEECGAYREEAGRCVDLVGAQVERGPDEHVPEAVDRGVARAEPAEDVAEGLAWPRLRAATPCRDDRNAQTVAQRQMRIAEQGGQARLDVGARAVLREDGKREARAQIRIALADALEEAEVLGEAAECDVLPVVGRRLRIAV